MQSAAAVETLERRGFQQLFGEVSMRNSRRLHTLHSTDDRQTRPDVVSIRSRFEMDMPSFLPNTSPEVPNFSHLPFTMALRGLGFGQPRQNMEDFLANAQRGLGIVGWRNASSVNLRFSRKTGRLQWGSTYLKVHHAARPIVARASNCSRASSMLRPYTSRGTRRRVAVRLGVP